MASKTSIIRVIQNLKFLSEWDGDWQQQWLDRLKINEHEAYKVPSLERAINQMSDQNNELRKKLNEEITNRTIAQGQAESLKSYIDSLNLEISKLKMRERQDQTFTAKLSGGAEITLTVPNK